MQQKALFWLGNLLEIGNNSCKTLISFSPDGAQEKPHFQLIKYHSPSLFVLLETKHAYKGSFNFMTRKVDVNMENAYQKWRELEIALKFTLQS